MSRLSEIEARLKAATPGPWWISEHDGSICHDTRSPTGEPDAELIGEADRSRDAELIASAPEDIATLLTLVREAREFVEMAGAADNSGEEYDPTCQACNERSGRHALGCGLAAWLTTVAGQETET